jgi:hypothetical protein
VRIIKQTPAVLETVSDTLRKRSLFLKTPGFTGMKMLVFLSALAAVIAGGGYVLYYVSKHPMLVSTLAPAPAPKPAPAPVQKPVQPSERNAVKEKVAKVPVASLPAPKRPDPEGEDVLPEKVPRASEAGDVNRRSIDEPFRQHMSSGMAALESGKHYVAQDAFIKAKNIKPDATEVKDALSQVDAAIRLKLIDDLKKEAAAAEQAEDWVGAADSYKAVLKIDGSLRFALGGKSRSLERLRMDKRLRYYIVEPDALASVQYLQIAAGLVEAADAVEPKGPRIRTQIETLKGLIRIAQTPIKIVIASDGITEVAIYRVGKFGRFQNKELHLRPGTYTIVGVREGYKDVLRKMVVKADDPPLQVTIRCEAPI